MNMNMDLIELYTREVGRNLPEKMRADIEKEIRSIIEDNLEDESEKAGRAPDEAMVTDVLKRLGPPEKVAASYQPPRYLIGPELYPHFITVLRLVITIVLIVTAVATGISLATGAPRNVAEVIGSVVGGLISAMINAAGVVVIIFAIIQATTPDIKLELGSETKPWEPAQLRREPDPDRVSVPELIVDVVFTFLILIVLVLYPQWLGITTVVDGEWRHLPVMSDAFFRFVPWLVLVWVLDIANNLWLIARGRWGRVQRWAAVGLSLATAALAAAMLSGPALTEVTAEGLASLGWTLTPEVLRLIVENAERVVRITLGILIATQVLDAGQHIYKMYRYRIPQAVITNK